jgi:protein-S-isoprenylcysteine O-methyltransferase Ste14
MPSLNLKIPPPIVALLLGGVMWVVSLITQSVALPAIGRVVAAIAIAIMGGGISLAGIVAFRRARTTVNPLKPEKTSSLVTSGIYTVTRNPMYVGLVLVLVAWAVFLSSAWGLSGPLAFFMYISTFQIQPEERVLSAMFGSAYLDYMSKVRRWL